MFPARLPLLLCVGLLMAVPSSPPLAGQETTAVRPHAGTSSGRSVKSLVSVCNDSTRLSDPTFAKNQAYLFAWTAFLAINCPAQSTSASPHIWETWKSVVDVYLPGGKAPAPWSAPQPPRVLLDRPEIDSYTLLDKNKQPVLSEIRMNKGTFDYIVQRSLYSKAGQLAFFASSGPPIDFPFGAMEIKAAWLILTPNDPNNSRYYTVQATYTDPETGKTYPVLAGLASLHIASKVLPDWFWTTFEQVDNQKATMAPETVPIPPDVRAFNSTVHAVLSPQSVWQFYQMRGAQMNYVNSRHIPSILANTLLETRFQKTSSCITCHNLATRGSLSQGTLSLWNVAGNGVLGHIGEVGAASNHYADATGKPICYESSTNNFTNCKMPNPTIVYKSMDFVWSLREAQ